MHTNRMKEIKFPRYIWCKLKFYLKKVKARKITQAQPLTIFLLTSLTVTTMALQTNTISLSNTVICSTYLYGKVEGSWVGQGEGVAWVIVRVVLEFRSQDITTFAILHKPPLVQLHRFVWKKRHLYCSTIPLLFPSSGAGLRPWITILMAKSRKQGNPHLACSSGQSQLW